MSWKSDRLFERFAHIRPPSITTRLTLLYSISAFCILVLATLFLYSILLKSLANEDEKFLQNEITILSTVIQQESQPIPVLQQELKEIAQHLYLARIIDEHGNEIVVSPHLTIPAANFPRPDASEQFSSVTHWHAKDKEHYLLVSAWAKRAHSNENWQIQIALNLQHEYNIIHAYRNHLFLVLILGVFCFALMGAIVARRGLSPLRKIARRTAKVTIAHLHERLDPHRWPREIVSLVKALNKMLDRIESAFTRLSQFSGDLAHELRTPINNIMGEAEIALTRARSIDEYQQVLESSLEECQRLSRMIDSLLFLARSENPKTQIQYAQFNVRPVLLSIAEFHEAVAAEKNITISCEGDAVLSADPILFRRAVSNLLSNALKYTSYDGKVTLTVSQPDPRYIYIAVNDTGEGIPEEHLAKIFDRFYRVDAARSKHSGGTGLGLSIVKSIMDLHNGSVTIASEPGVGSTITLIFPVQAPLS